MPTRTIVTSQPDVACDVCGRRLLRGEQPDAFVAAGRRLVVCELCAPRATHEGWLRESESAPLALPPLRPRRARSLLDRLPVPDWVRQAGADRFARSGADAEPGFEEPGSAPFDAQASHAEAPTEPAGEAEAQGPPLEPERPLSYVEQGLSAFNASEFPRRIAGVARSLGPPEISVRSAEHLESVVVIVVAWELCWYRYEADLSEGFAETRGLEQGTELSELPHDDRLANATALEDGTLALRAA